MKLQALRWSSVAAVLLAAQPTWAQVPPVPRTQPRPNPAPPVGAPPGPVAPAVPGAGPGRGGTPAETPPGAQPTPPQSFDAIAKIAESPYRPKPMGTRVKFNLQDADLGELVNHISGMTGKRFIYGPKVRQIKATVVSPEPVTLAEAYEAFLSILEANGMTVIPHGQFLKIVDSAGVATASTPIYSRGAPVPETDRFVTRLYRLRNTGADEVAGLLAKFKSKDGDVSTYAPGQLLIITDTGTQVQRMIRIVEEVDVGGAGAKMWIEPVNYGSAQELSQKVNELFDLGKGDNGSGLAKIVPDPTSNSLIVVGTEEGYLRLLELLKRLDSQPTREGNVHVLQLQNSVAEELANTLNQMLQGAAKGGAAGDPKAAQRSAFEGEVRVTADKATNALVITSSSRDYAALRIVIEELDRRRRQVFLEAVIMSLSVNNATNLGLKYHGGTLEKVLDNKDSLIYGGLAPLGTIMPPSPTDTTMLQGFALGIRGPEIPGASTLLGVGISVPAFGVMLNALAKSGQVNVLATPHILATDNTEATINVGENIPLQENFGGGMPNLGALSGQTGAASGMAGMGMMGMMGGMGFNAQRQDVGTKIKVTPHINEANQVRLEIEQEISERGASSGALGVVSITKRNVSTTLIVDDQQTVVIGGLMRDETSRSRDKIPVLGDLPVLGFLFRSSKKEIRKTNLLLVLTPYVVNDQADLRRIFERKMEERQEFLDRYFVFNGEDWKPPKDYARTSGLVEEIRHSYAELEERERIEEESRPREELVHDAQESIDLPMDVKAGPVAPGAAPAAPAVAPGARTRRRPTKAPIPGATPSPVPPPPAPPPPAPPTGLLDSPFGNTRMARNINLEPSGQ